MLIPHFKLVENRTLGRFARRGTETGGRAKVRCGEREDEELEKKDRARGGKSVEEKEQDEEQEQ